MSKNGGFVMTNKKLDVLNYLQKKLNMENSSRNFFCTWLFCTQH